MNKTLIGTVKNPDGTQGYTWNPITGCLNHVNGMCKGGNFPCYAYRLANTRLKEMYLDWSFHMDWATYCEIPQIEVEQMHKDPFYPRFWQDKMWLHELVGSKRKAKGIFVCNMSDLFGIGIPEDWTRRILTVISKHPRHRFYLLTKQPQNLVKFSPFPDHVYVGVTATDLWYYSRALGFLRDVVAPIKYLSLEPLLGQLSPSPVALRLSGIKWVIIGGLSGKQPFYPPEKWIQEIEEAADKARIPVFEKHNLRKVWSNYPRQEMPTK